MSRPRSATERLVRTLSPSEWTLALAALTLGGWMAYHVYNRGLMTALTDQSSHLNFARLTFDSLTPGVSQLGFWPPLLHTLLMPFVAVPFLYQSGFAGAIVLVPCLIASVVALHRITMTLTGNRTLAVAAGATMAINPYVLYYSATPMMEILFLTSVFVVAYAMLKWMTTDSLPHLLIAGIGVALACLSRFEGFILLPITTGVIVLRVLRKRTSYAQAEALLTLFALLAVVGMCVIVLYSWVYGDSPLAFTGGDWLRDPAAALRPSRFNVMNTFLESLIASFYMLGRPLVATASACLGILLIARRVTFERAVTLLILASPLLFVLFGLYAGMVTVNVPEFPPYGGFNNDRYGLTWIGFAVLAPILFIHEFNRLMSMWKLLGPRIRGTIVAIACGGLLATQAVRFYEVTFADDFAIIRANINSPLPEHVEVATVLRQHYVNGRVLSARVDNDPIFARAGIPLRKYIYEGNYRYFKQAVAEPWFFAEWVLMHNPDGSIDGWAQQHEPVYLALGNSDEFKRYYDLVLRNDKRLLYKLNENHLLQLARDQGLNPAEIPSLNPEAVAWDPGTVYAKMTAPAPAMTPEELIASKATVKSRLLAFYWNALKPEYENGVHVDESGRGNSESQSYAMKQSLAVDDVDMFDTVWTWTKENIRRSDGLFAWKFRMRDDGTVAIEDAHAATDADTDIAEALLLANERWARPGYIVEALPILDAIWDKETTEANGKRHIVAGDWKVDPDAVTINPSYFSPAAYRTFARYDPRHDWLSLIPTGYDDVEGASALAESKGGLFLPPNWIDLSESTGAYEPFEAKADGMDYSYDAFRTFWRIAEDRKAREPRAGAYLDRMQTFNRELRDRNRLCSTYVYATSACSFDAGTLAGPIAYWLMTDPAQADDALRVFAFNGGDIGIPENDAFYRKSWQWFMLWQWAHA